VAGNVVKDIRLRQVIQFVVPANGDRGGELAVAEAIEENEGRNVTAYRFGLKSGQRAQKAIDVLKPGDALRVQAQRADAVQELRVRVTLPTRNNARIQRPPGLLVLLGIQFVGLPNEQVA
jgi:hypothetical protein